jgi:hypothetical protein
VITAIVTLPLPPGLGREEAAANYAETAPRYVDMPGLVRKLYLYAEGQSGGIYQWETRAQAEAAHGPEWCPRVRERYGAEPSVQYFDTPVIVDNVTGSIDAFAPG